MTSQIWLLLAAIISYVYYKIAYKVVPVDTGNLLDSYDYVIVGAGSAGSVLASRLSEDPNVTVLLLEAGPDDVSYPDIRIPMQTLSLWGRSDVAWLYKTTRQRDACKSMKGQRCSWPKGKVVGGSSSINAMIYLRGHPEDYDRWASAGCDGWSYDDVLPYFIKAESNLNPLFTASTFHGAQGPMLVADANRSGQSDLLDAFLRAGRQLGYEAGDVNGDDCTEKFMHNQANVRDGERLSMFDAYVRPALHARSNLHVKTGAHVRRVLFSENAAVGVQVKLAETGTVNVRIRREVLLSAGTVGSPQILMLSGVGPRDHLESLDIGVVADLPVGDNLQDHLLLPVLQFTLEAPVSFVAEEIGSFREMLRYALFKKGLLAHPAGIQGHAFFKSMHQKDADRLPYIKVILSAAMIGGSYRGLQQYANTINQDVELQRQVFGGHEGQHGFHLFPVILHPESRGRIRLTSKDPDEYPAIDPRYLSDRRDVVVMTEAVRLAEIIAASEAFDKLGATMIRNHHPDCRDHEFDTDAYWECVIRHMVVTEFHPVGTCRMGSVDDPKTVVDSQLRVKGVKSLRVVDASVIPELISGNTNAPVVMLAEKASDMIKQSINDRQR